MEGIGTQHPRPLNREYYEQVRQEAAEADIVEEVTYARAGPFVMDVSAGEIASIELVEGPQIVNLFVYNTHDPDERLWAHETMIIEGLFLTRYYRLWGIMARFRPLLTILEDTVSTRPTFGDEGAKHHIIYGGGNVPLVWQWAGGSRRASTTWEQLTAGLATRDLPPHLLMDDACLFQKTRLDAYSQRLVLLPSDAVSGDHVDFFAEIDVTLVLALSPYVDGSLDPRELSFSAPRPVTVKRRHRVAEPLGWPYPGIAYPDLSLYLDDHGVRTTVPGPTLDREASA